MRIICDKFNKGPIYKSVIGGEGNPRHDVPGAGNRKPLCYRRRMEWEGSEEMRGGAQSGLLEDATAGEMKSVPPTLPQSCNNEARE